MEEKQKHKGRVFLLVGVIIAVFVVFALRLMKYQIVDAKNIGRWHRETTRVPRASMQRAERCWTDTVARLQSIRSAMM